MDQAIVDELRAEGNRGIEALKRNQADQAGLHFTNALNRAEDLQDDRTRRDETSALAQLFHNYGFYDLSLMASEEAVDLDRELGLTNLMAQDIVGVGNSHISMENTAKAEEYYREALAIFLDQNDLANAASANTNIAGIIANRGDLAEAIELLETSLRYLSEQPFYQTEIQTRIALLQAIEIEELDVNRAIENARQLCSRFFNKMPDIQQTLTSDFVSRAIDRYLRANPEIDAEAWQAQNFPMFQT